jgi:flagellar basal-body rod protein FlgB
MSGGTEIARLFGVESPKTQNEDRLWEHGLLLRGKRLELLAGNIANADTPNYKARDFDFAQALAEADAGSDDLPMVTNSPLHVDSSPTAAPTATPLYRIPYQASLDGNTVEMSVEQAAFSENQVRYQVELNHVSGDFKEMNDLLTELK